MGDAQSDLSHAKADLGISRAPTATASDAFADWSMFQPALESLGRKVNSNSGRLCISFLNVFFIHAEVV